MSALEDYQNDDTPNPLDVIETLATANDWLFDRSANDESLPPHELRGNGVANHQGDGLLGCFSVETIALRERL